MVIKDIYIGPSQAADNEDGLKKIGITHIINLGNEDKKYQKVLLCPFVSSSPLKCCELLLMTILKRIYFQFCPLQTFLLNVPVELVKCLFIG